jgi:hypothetical protein
MILPWDFSSDVDGGPELPIEMGVKRFGTINLILMTVSGGEDPKRNYTN